MNPEALKDYDALIFDMDGTLVDSGQLHEVAWRETLTEYGLPIDHALMRSLAGVPTMETVRLIAEKTDTALTASLEEINDFKERVVKENIHRYVKATALERVARHYHGTKPMAVGTGAYTDEAREILSVCGLLDLLDAVVGADQVARPKPAPDTFLACAELIGVSPSRCIVFEDSPLGLRAAEDAGMKGIDVAAELDIHNHYFL